MAQRIRSVLTVGAAALGAALFMTMNPAQAADVGVSIAISQPGIFGRIDIGRYPNPVVVTQAPVIVAPPPVARPGYPVVVAQPQPLYLWVPPGHRRHWSRHCQEYGACGHPVYFVRDDWYQQHVYRGAGRAPGYERHGERHGDYRGNDRGGDRGDRDDHGLGRGHGHRD